MPCLPGLILGHLDLPGLTLGTTAKQNTKESFILLGVDAYALDHAGGRRSFANTKATTHLAELMITRCPGCFIVLDFGDRYYEVFFFNSIFHFSSSQSCGHGLISLLLGPRDVQCENEVPHSGPAHRDGMKARFAVEGPDQGCHGWMMHMLFLLLTYLGWIPLVLPGVVALWAWCWLLNARHVGTIPGRQGVCVLAMKFEDGGM